LKVVNVPWMQVQSS